MGSAGRDSTAAEPQTIKEPRYVRLRENLFSAWEIAVLLSTVYLSVQIPVVVGFYTESEISPVFIGFQYFADLLFATNIIVRTLKKQAARRSASAASEAQREVFHEAVRTMAQPTESSVSVVSQDVVIITPSRGDKGSAWYRTTLWLDIFSVLPLELLAPLFPTTGTRLNAEMMGRVLLMNRILRARLLFSALGVMQRMMRSPLLQILRLVFAFLLLAHWFGCAFFFIGEFQNKPNVYVGRPWVQEFGLETADITTQYVSSLYWALVTMTSVGYGDIYASTNVEKTYVTAVILAAALAYASIFGTVSVLVQEVAASSAQLKERVHAVSEFASLYGLPEVLHKKLLDYTAVEWSATKGFEPEAILSMLPYDLRARTAALMRRRIMSLVPVLRDADTHVAHAIALRLRTQVCLKGDAIVRFNDPTADLYFVETGSVEVLVPNRGSVTLLPDYSASDPGSAIHGLAGMMRAKAGAREADSAVVGDGSREAARRRLRQAVLRLAASRKAEEAERHREVLRRRRETAVPSHDESSSDSGSGSGGGGGGGGGGGDSGAGVASTSGGESGSESESGSDGAAGAGSVAARRESRTARSVTSSTASDAEGGSKARGRSRLASVARIQGLFRPGVDKSTPTAAAIAAARSSGADAVVNPGRNPSAVQAPAVIVQLPFVSGGELDPLVARSLSASLPTAPGKGKTAGAEGTLPGPSSRSRADVVALRRRLQQAVETLALSGTVVIGEPTDPSALKYKRVEWAPVNVLRQGSTFGEVELLLGVSRTATVRGRAATTTLACISADDLEDLLESAPHFKAELIEIAIRRLRRDVARGKRAHAPATDTSGGPAPQSLHIARRLSERSAELLRCAEALATEAAAAILGTEVDAVANSADESKDGSKDGGSRRSSRPPTPAAEKKDPATGLRRAVSALRRRVDELEGIETQRRKKSRKHTKRSSSRHGERRKKARSKGKSRDRTRDRP